MTLACSSAVSYVANENVVHSIDLNKNASASVGGGCNAIIDGRGPRSSGRCCSNAISAASRQEKLGASTDLECTFDGPFSSNHSHTIHIKPVLPRPSERKPTLPRIRSELERNEEKCVSFDGIITKGTCI
jgi:hypothetical protein